MFNASTASSEPNQAAFAEEHRSLSEGRAEALSQLQTVQHSQTDPPASRQLLRPGGESDWLDVAAERMRVGDQAGVSQALAKHLAKNPDQIVIRSYLAESLYKQKRYAEAKHHYETFSREAAIQGGGAMKQLTHCHTRLMEVAQELNDEYGERLHRGIGMMRLADESAPEGSRDPAILALKERLLNRAIRELQMACELTKDDPLPWCYLSRCHRLNDDSRQATAAARIARRKLSPTIWLTPQEHNWLIEER